jgi:tetratricopeptide (TPR) repeat protein
MEGIPMKLKKLSPLLGVLLLVMVSFGCSKLRARDQLNKGVAAYRGAQFQAAIDHFRQAVNLDPNLLNARLFLATAMRQLYVPGGDSPENTKAGKDAINAFEDVLKVDPNNTTALATIGETYYEMKQFDKAKEYQRRLQQLDPNDPSPYYWIGVIDWSVCFPRRMGLRNDLRLTTPKDPAKPSELPPLPAKAREELAAKNGPLVQEAIQALEKDIELKPNDAGAFAYLNLMYREKADLEADNSMRQADIQKAEGYFRKWHEITKQETAKASTTGS